MITLIMQLWYVKRIIIHPSYNNNNNDGDYVGCVGAIKLINTPFQVIHHGCVLYLITTNTLWLRQLVISWSQQLKLSSYMKMTALYESPSTIHNEISSDVNSSTVQAIITTIFITLLRSHIINNG